MNRKVLATGILFFVVTNVAVYTLSHSVTVSEWTEGRRYPEECKRIDAIDDDQKWQTEKERIISELKMVPAVGGRKDASIVVSRLQVRYGYSASEARALVLKFRDDVGGNYEVRQRCYEPRYAYRMDQISADGGYALTKIPVLAQWAQALNAVFKPGNTE